MGFGDKGKKEKAHDKASEAEASNKAATEDVGSGPHFCFTSSHGGTGTGCTRIICRTIFLFHDFAVLRPQSQSCTRISSSSSSKASWEDNEKGLKAKANRAAAKDAKADDAVRKAQEKKEREAEEAAELDAMSGKAAAKKKKDAPSKLTQAQIQRNLALMAAANSTVRGSTLSNLFLQHVDGLCWAT